MKQFSIEIEFNSVELHISAKNKTEARKKALKRLSKRNPVNLIQRNWITKRKNIWIDEI